MKIRYCDVCDEYTECDKIVDYGEKTYYMMCEDCQENVPTFYEALKAHRERNTVVELFGSTKPKNGLIGKKIRVVKNDNAVSF